MRVPRTSGITSSNTNFPKNYAKYNKNTCTQTNDILKKDVNFQGAPVKALKKISKLHKFWAKITKGTLTELKDGFIYITKFKSKNVQTVTKTTPEGEKIEEILYKKTRPIEKTTYEGNDSKTFVFYNQNWCDISKTSKSFVKDMVDLLMNPPRKRNLAAEAISE